MSEKRRRTLLLLGGSRYLEPVLEVARGSGIRTVTCDYLPGNWAHAHSDQYVNASVVDREAVLAVAREVRADGIMSFACDPGVTTAAWVAERLGLPFQGPYESVRTLQDKGQFRTFLRDNGFACPEVTEVSSEGEARELAESLAYPVIAKPADSAGSKGCSRVDAPCELAGAVREALPFSRSGRCVVESFLEKAFPSSDSDCFTVGGDFRCVSFTSQLFDGDAENPYAPAGYAMPADMPETAQEELVLELQRLSGLLGLRDGVYNVETRVATDGVPYIMEVSPRGGGNRLCEMLRLASGVDLVSAAVRAAVGEDPGDVRKPSYDGVWYQEVLHADRHGLFAGVEWDPAFAEAHLADQRLWVFPGDEVRPFSAANFAIGSAMLRFGSVDELDGFLARKEDVMKVAVS